MEEIKEPEEFMQVADPVKEVPSYASSRQGKYAAIYAQVDLLEKGQWLPVTVGTRRQAQRLQECAKLKNYRAKRRGLTLYISQGEAKRRDNETKH